MQSERIKERINEFGGKLYLEFGGKLFDDYHASRVLPGFEPDSKLQMLLQLKEQAEIVLVISADDIEKNKIRGDLGITYSTDALRLIKAFEGMGLMVGSVVLTKYVSTPRVNEFEQKLKNRRIPFYHHYLIDGYPANISKIVSDEGYGKNDYIKTTADKTLSAVVFPNYLNLYRRRYQYRRQIAIDKVFRTRRPFRQVDHACLVPRFCRRL